MNRVLRRPMFRLGGSAEGITSGLDGPNINASRQGYAEAGAVMQRPQPTTKEEFLAEKERLKSLMGEDLEKESMAPGSLSSLLTNFSLNLAAQPGGNLMGAIGRAGAPALEKFQESRQLERLQKRKADRELGLEAYRSLTGLKEAEWDAFADITEGGGVAGKKSYEFLARDEKLAELQNEEDKIKNLITSAQKTFPSVPGVPDDISGASKPVNDKAIKELVRSLEKNKERQKLITGEEDKVGTFILKAIVAETMKPGTNEVYTIDDYFEYIKDPENWKGADGGRVGLAMGGTPLMEEMVEQVEETGSDQVADLTYNELRSRLPQEISNDIVSLLANSKSALVDFANIITQQDVDNFNQLYNVDLVLPQEG